MATNKKVERKFEKEFVNGLLIRTFKQHPFLVDKIKRVMQEMYDLGHADGVADAYYEYNKREEENGNL